MGHQVVKMPNGKYAVWSTCTDSFVFLNATPEEVETFEIKSRESAIRQAVQQEISMPLTTWEEAIADTENIHGKEARDELVAKYGAVKLS